MKRYLLILTLTLILPRVKAQQDEPILVQQETEQQLEKLAEQQDGEPEDDAYLQTLVQFKKNKLNMNTADENDLKELQMLSALQIQNFLKYRRLLTNLINIYELQAVPTWDVATIKKVLPFITVANLLPFRADLKQRLTEGQHSILLRLQQVVEKSEGYARSDSVANRYIGSPQKVLFRYKYSFRNLLQFGITAEKDAGEELFAGNRKAGFDFYSVHLFARKWGPFKLLAVGDFTVNLGQGLIHWQSLSFKKSAEITAVKRQASVLRPYNSPGEYNFMRGVGATVGIKNLDFTAFASSHRLDGTLNSDTSQINADFLSTILNSGYHRTPTEILKKNIVTQTAVGGNVSFNKNSFHIGFNAVAFHYSVPIVRRILAYNLYAVQGNNWHNYSIDYGYTFHNFHVFGEAAHDKNNHKAFVGGLIASLDAKVDASVVYRNIDKEYQSLYGNAFTESSAPTNEKGLFTGLSIKPSPILKIDTYADIFSFPWLRYRVDAPSVGSAYLVQLTYIPNKQITMFTRFENGNKAINLVGTNLPVRQVFVRPKQNWRTELIYRVNRQFIYNHRVEMVWFDSKERDRSQEGFLMYAEGTYKCYNRPWTVNSRIQYFETGGFDSRLYAFESDVQYSYSIPQFSGKGFRYYLNANVDFSKKISFSVRWAQTIYSNQNAIGSGLDKIDGNKKSEWKIQVVKNF